MEKSTCQIGHRGPGESQTGQVAVPSAPTGSLDLHRSGRPFRAAGQNDHLEMPYTLFGKPPQHPGPRLCTRDEAEADIAKVLIFDERGAPVILAERGDVLVF